MEPSLPDRVERKVESESSSAKYVKELPLPSTVKIVGDTEEYSVPYEEPPKRIASLKNLNDGNSEKEPVQNATLSATQDSQPKLDTQSKVAKEDAQMTKLLSLEQDPILQKYMNMAKEKKGEEVSHFLDIFK